MEKTVDEVYDDFWKKHVENPDGSINKEQLKNELYDFWKIMQMVPVVYEHVTGGSLTKIMTKPEHIIKAADDYYDEYHNGLNDELIDRSNSV